ncbi:hypothetical protein VB773_15265 [Haloarculaceae archaeon H-GB2-1]|nr:hypothetical protein [Haloarculaceae archaeon H-GB11]MEA5408789.1 hypothetical protein [Haloarculaceae archaeon H-GB2-1]
MGGITNAKEGYRYWQVRVSRQVRREYEATSRPERTLWLLVVVTLLADTALTIYGLRQGLVEEIPRYGWRFDTPDWDRSSGRKWARSR